MEKNDKFEDIYEKKKRNLGRSGINPKTKETLEIAAHNRPRFTAGKALKDAC